MGRKPEGSVQQFGDGKFRIWVSGGRDETGKRHRVTEVVEGSLKGAYARIRAIRASIDDGTYIPKQPETLAQFIRGWWPSKKASVAETTGQGYERLIARYIVKSAKDAPPWFPDLGKRQLQKIRPADISGALQTLVERDRRGQADKLYTLLRLIFNSAIKARSAAVNPVLAVDRPARRFVEQSIISPEQWREIRDHLRRVESWAYLPLALLISSGMRRSELAGLRWADLDLGAGTLTVQRSYHVLTGGREVIKETKSRRARRSIALDPHTRAMLAEHRKACERVARMFGRKLEPDDWMFTRIDERGDIRPIRPQTLTQVWRRTARRFGFRVRLHDLRHSAASMLLAAGVDVHLISRRLGHASAAFTMDQYGHLMPNAQAEAAAKLAAMLNGEGPPELPSSAENLLEIA